MAIDLESHLGGMLQDENLSQTERAHVEELRAANVRFLEENRGKIYPVSPFNYGELHIRSMADIRVGNIYTLYESSDEGQSFQEQGKVVITKISRKFGEWQTHGPFRLELEIVYNNREDTTFARMDPWELGLEPISKDLLDPKIANLPYISIWDPNSYLAQMELPK